MPRFSGDAQRSPRRRPTRKHRNRNPDKTMKTENQNLFRVAIVGAATLKGKELKEVLEERSFPAVDIRLLDDDESLGNGRRGRGCCSDLKETQGGRK